MTKFICRVCKCVWDRDEVIRVVTRRAVKWICGNPYCIGTCDKVTEDETEKETE